MKKSIIFTIYLLFIRCLCVKKNRVYFESHGSNDFGGNMYRIAEELLNGSYGNMEIYISVRDEIPKTLHLLLNNYPNKCIKLVKRASLYNFYIYATAKYLFTDVDFLSIFIKRKEQIIAQTWHGTPLKHLGFDYYADISFTSNQKRAFALADYCLFPNHYTYNMMTNSYRLMNCMKGKALIDGYPRNAIFFDNNSADCLRNSLNLSDKKVFVYMPTWRGSVTEGATVTDKIQDYLYELDQSLTNDQVLFAKLHRLAKDNIDFSEFHHIRPFPDEYETYQFLSIADYLITDYSSVMFDFLCTRKKIILFAYDKDKYYEQQGMYLQLEDLPFPIVNNINDLVKELNLEKQYDDTSVSKEFCPYDDGSAAKRFCETVINDINCSKEELDLSHSNKSNILLYAGVLAANNATCNFFHMIDNIDFQSNNYVITFLNNAFKSNPIRFQSVPKSCDVISVNLYEGSYICMTLSEKVAWHYYRKSPFLRGLLYKKVKSLFQREFARQFWGIEWEKIIRFGGLDFETFCMFVFAPVKNKYILIYPEMQNNAIFNLIIQKAEQNNCKLIYVQDNYLLRPKLSCNYSMPSEFNCFC